MKAFKAFIRPFEAPQISVKIKIQPNFLFQYNFQKCTGWEGLKIKEALHINWRNPNLNAQQKHLDLTFSL